MATGKEKEIPAAAGTGDRDYRSHRYAFRLNDEENTQFNSMLEESGAPTITKFICGRLFAKEFKVWKKSAELHQYYTRLCGFYRQFAALGNNYNQTVKAIHRTFGEPKARQLLKDLRATTAELSEVGRKIIVLTQEFGDKWEKQLP